MSKRRQAGEGERSGFFEGSSRGSCAGDVSVDDTTRQPPSSDHHWNMGCVSPFYVISYEIFMLWIGTDKMQIQVWLKIT